MNREREGADETAEPRSRHTISVGLSPEEMAEPDEFAEGDFEAQMKWIATGEGNPWGSSSRSLRSDFFRHFRSMA
jgi:hypothetical protein